jgi:UDPglucose 6-dehydrogenase
MLNCAIVGFGFVGKAVSHGFANESVIQYIIDPLNGAPIEILADKEINVSFVCVPTPMGEDGSIDSSIVQEVIQYLIENVTGVIVLKSTVVPNLVQKFYDMAPERFVYNPEFLVEATALDDFINPSMHVFGGDSIPTAALKDIYMDFSNCSKAPTYFMTAAEAAFVKYGINSFLMLKVLFFNQLYSQVEKNSVNYDTIIQAIVSDDRIGPSHTMVPGPDGRKGSAGACFAKDIPGFIKFSNNEMSILQEAWNANCDIRKSYGNLLAREKEQHIGFNKIF